jgi:tetratricopeptide (TPR) repeat protein
MVNQPKRTIEFRKYLLFVSIIISMFIDVKSYGQLNSQHEDINLDVQVSSNDKVVKLNEKSIKLAQNGNLIEAESLILEALRIEPNNYVLIANYGNIKTDLSESIRLLNKSYKLSDSTYHVAGSNLSRLYCINNEFNKGIDIATFVISNTKNDMNSYIAYFHRIINYLGLNECEEARKDLKVIKTDFKHIPNSDGHINNIVSIINTKCKD